MREVGPTPPHSRNCRRRRSPSFPAVGRRGGQTNWKAWAGRREGWDRQREEKEEEEEEEGAVVSFFILS